MALKPDRTVLDTDITMFWSELTAQQTQTKGGVASVETIGSGVAMDHDRNVVQYAAAASGAVPKGILVQDVNPALSSTRDYKNFHNLEIRPGEKCTLIRKGWVVTDKLSGTPTAGGAAYVGASGLIATTQAAGAVQIGRFETTVDSGGFARVYIDI
jgi:hypothetical protein